MDALPDTNAGLQEKLQMKWGFVLKHELQKFKYKAYGKTIMADVKCKHCDEKMMKKGVIQSGNSKYDVYRCNECGHEEMKAIGVNPGYHR